MNGDDTSMNAMLMKRLGQLAKYHDTGEGRPLEELKMTKGTLRGVESQRLRTFCTSNCMEPQRDLDTFGSMLMSGKSESVRIDDANRLMNESRSSAETIKELYEMRWGPTKVPLYNLLGLFMQIIPDQREDYLKIAKYYIDMGVLVDGTDLSGSTALSQSFSTKPCLDLEYAQMLFDAGGDVNNRNRYGGIVAHEIVQVYDMGNPEVARRASKALEWFMTHGGNVDIADGDGMSPRDMCASLARVFPQFQKIIQKEEDRRKGKKDSCCSMCGRDTEKSLACSRCKRARYCDPKVRACQKLDWPKHKKGCKP